MGAPWRGPGYRALRSRSGVQLGSGAPGIRAKALRPAQTIRDSFRASVRLAPARARSARALPATFRNFLVWCSSLGLFKNEPSLTVGLLSHLIRRGYLSYFFSLSHCLRISSWTCVPDDGRLRVMPSAIIFASLSSCTAVIRQRALPACGVEFDGCIVS